MSQLQLTCVRLTSNNASLADESRDPDGEFGAWLDVEGFGSSYFVSLPVLAFSFSVFSFDVPGFSLSSIFAISDFCGSQKQKQQMLKLPGAKVFFNFYLLVDGILRKRLDSFVDPKLGYRL